MQGIIVKALLNAVAKYITEHGTELLGQALELLKARLPEGTSEILIMLIDLVIDSLPKTVSADGSLDELAAEMDAIVAGGE